jgi:DNA-binding NtrC family response regulator
VERGEILAALDRFGGNRTRAARYLGIHRKTLREKMGKYRIERGSR